MVPTLGESMERHRGAWYGTVALCAGLVTAAYWHSFTDIYYGSTAPESLYSHALFIPVICLFFVWRQRTLLRLAPLQSSPLLGYPLLLGGCLMLLVGDFLGFMTVVHFSLLPVVCGLCFLMLGQRATFLLWFPLAFLFFMLPMPYSLVSVISFKSKMLATESAVFVGQLLTLNLVQDGSFVYLGSDDRLLVGDVCGGMRSLIALLAFGALMAYISKTRGWARIIILIISPAVAIAANVARIFFLCMVGYFWGSESATGLVHDASGIGIFAFAFVLLFGAEGLLRRFAPAPESKETDS
jgi:exosortase